MKLAVTVHVFTYKEMGYHVSKINLVEPKEQISLYVSTFFLFFHKATKNESIKNIKTIYYINVYILKIGAE